MRKRTSSTADEDGRPSTAQSQALSIPSPRTVYSDVSHLKDDDVGYSIGLRNKKGTKGLENAFLPNLDEVSAEDDEASLLSKVDSEFAEVRGACGEL